MKDTKHINISVKKTSNRTLDMWAEMKGYY